MQVAEALVPPWQATLDLGFARRGGQTLLARRHHRGPLRVQKALYPEGPGVCQVLVLHPPSGIAGGDELEIGACLETGTHAQLTTPGAGKWYRSAGPWAAQRLAFELAPGAVLEWLPQETIVFDGARADMDTNVALAEDALFIGWEVLCLGRRASGETFDRGALRLETRITRAGRPLWLERGRIAGGDPLLAATAGLAGYSVCASLLAAGRPIDPGLIKAGRQIVPVETGAQHGITTLPHLLVARYLGHSSEAARAWFAGLWRLLRPALIGREAVPPRIWNT